MSRSGPGTAWIIADVWETIAATRPDSECVVHGATSFTWREFSRTADEMASQLLAHGVGHQTKVAFFLRNSPAFLIGVFACLKAGLVPVNTNFRYSAAEAAKQWADADVEVVIFSTELTTVVAEARELSSAVSTWFWVGDDDGCPEWAVPFPVGPSAATPEGVRAPWGRSPDDLVLLYTGGTTGAPKGVMWRQDDVFAILNDSARVRYAWEGGLAGVARRQLTVNRPRPRFLPCGPLVHGTGGWSSYGVLGAGGTVVLLSQQSFRPDEVLDLLDREAITHLGLVGDAHARPVVDLLDRAPGRWRLDSVRLITSSGMTLSQETRERLLRHCRDALCVDILGSSEVPLVGRSRSTAGQLAPTATFSVGPDVRVLDESGRDVARGTGEVGLVAVAGRHPLGYFKDPEGSAAMFREVDGRRWAVPGDVARVGADGTIDLLGRGSAVINTGGEKVYAREVEEALLRDPAVADVGVVGVPDPRLGQRIVAAVQPRPGATVDVDNLLERLRGSLAGYKVPKALHVLPSIGRSESGKLNQPELVDLLSGISSPTADPAPEHGAGGR